MSSIDVDSSLEVQYELIHSNPEENAETRIIESQVPTPNRVLMNFIVMSILFSANHGAMVSCLAFATLQLGSTGAWQLTFFHLIYAASALLGATYVVKQMGARNSMTLGMAMYATYVLCFWMTLEWESFLDVLAVIGAIVGGIGGGLVWTAQGSYFGRASQLYATASGAKSDHANSFLAGIFAFIYLAEEVVCKLLSWALLRSNHTPWSNVFGVYTVVAFSSTFLMFAVDNYPCVPSGDHYSMCYKVTAAWQLLTKNSKMRYMIGLNAVFGFAYPFVNSYVNGEVVHRVISQDINSKYVGIFSAITSGVAAICSLIFGRASQSIGQGPILVLGAMCFAALALMFVVQPNLHNWGWSMLSMAYSFQGMGRATFEGSLRATFADFFPQETEGAFANIILQNGCFTALGFYLSFAVTCSNPSAYCVKYKEGGLHNVLALESAIIVSALCAIWGYCRASILFHEEQELNIHHEDLEGMRETLLTSEDINEFRNADESTLIRRCAVEGVTGGLVEELA